MQTQGRITGDTAQYVGEPSLRVDAVELGGGDQGVDRCGALATAVGTSEQPRPTPECGVCQGNRCGRESAEYIDDRRTPRAFSRPLASGARSRAPSSALRFAEDSTLEEAGFELSVPPAGAGLLRR